MEDESRDAKKEHEDKIRCANFLLLMFEKYGAEILNGKDIEICEEA